MWNLADEFCFVYRPLTGDGVIIARVENMSAADVWSKAGLMIRESLSTDSKHGFVFLSGAQGLSFQRRAVTGDWTEIGRLWGGGMVWLKLERQGSTLTAFSSDDGVNWFAIGRDSFAMNATVYVGLALTSHAPLTYASRRLHECRRYGGIELGLSRYRVARTLRTDVAQSSLAVFTPLSNQSTAVSRCVLEVFPVGADPNASGPAARLDLGLPPTLTVSVK